MRWDANGEFIMWYDRQGNPVDGETVVRKMKDLAYKTVLKTSLANGRSLSTIWLGTDYSHTAGPPLIFETAVFVGGEIEVLERYASEAEALEGHARAEQWQGKL
ncbi:hypothetical protein LCGC14_0441580 [marine sediment metagenome]|uniref:Uncharacterized protein n=1 Tax=marine sediment metagenome TaxID=412755 RepID=A0A0F9V7D7_9ZZZZ